MIDAHPALKAVCPPAPAADMFFADLHHHGAFFLVDVFNFLAVFGVPRSGLTTEWAGTFDHGTSDGYQFFLDLGPLKNVNRRHLKHRISFCDAILEHPNYDEFWQARNILPRLHNVAPAVMRVGVRLDAEQSPAG